MSSPKSSTKSAYPEPQRLRDGGTDPRDGTERAAGEAVVVISVVTVPRQRRSYLDGQPTTRVGDATGTYRHVDGILTHVSPKVSGPRSGSEGSDGPGCRFPACGAGCFLSVLFGDPRRRTARLN